MKIAIVQGTRPEIIKNYSIVKALQKQDVPFLVLHTNQHTESKMRDEIYHDMGYRPNDVLDKEYSLGTAIDWLQKSYKKHKINHVLVNGDTTASLAGALAAQYSDIPVTHVEAGLRSRDIHMLEERNRIMVDAIASLLFAYTNFEKELLSSTPDIRGNVLVEGNTTIDVISDFQHKFTQKPLSSEYIFVTLHRRELTDSEERMQCVVNTLNEISNTICDVIFPVHPRTMDAISRYQLIPKLNSSIQIIEPLTPLEALGYQKHAAAILTDSGCIQEEAYILNIPCITLRENTERHLTISHGANRLSGFNQRKIITLIHRALNQKNRNWPLIYGKPGVGERIVQNITDYMHGNVEKSVTHLQSSCL